MRRNEEGPPRIVAVGMVRNEADIVEAFVRHTLQFVDELRLIDHLSTDRTTTILSALQAEGLPLRFTRQTGHAMVQEVLTTELAVAAFADGAAWVVPLNCDEFIEAQDRDGLRRHLAGDAGRDVQWWPLISMVPHPSDDLGVTDPVRRIVHRLKTETLATTKCLVPLAVTKVRGWQFAPGNHYVVQGDGRPVPMVRMPVDFKLRHYPVRSKAQIMSKMVLGRLAWMPRLTSGSSLSRQTRDFFDRLKTGWVPTDQDLTTFACNYQNPGCSDIPALVVDPLNRMGALAYTTEAEVAFLPRLLEWAEQSVLRGTASLHADTYVERLRPQLAVEPPKRKKRPFPDQAALLFNAANAAHRDGDNTRATTLLSDVLRHAPYMVEAHVLMGRVLRRLGDVKGASKAYRAALKIEPDLFDARLEHGNVMRVLGEIGVAEAEYRKAMSARPMDPRPTLALARLLEEQPGVEERERAAVALQQAVDRAAMSNNPGKQMLDLYHDIARFRLNRGDLPLAMEALRQARLLAPDRETRALTDLATSEVYLRLGMATEAKAMMEALSATAEPMVLRRLAALAYRFNYWAEAVEILGKCVTLDPLDAQAHLDLADMQVKSWLMEDALRSLARADALGSLPRKVLSAMKASIANRLGDAETSLAIYEQLVAEGQASFASSAAMSLLYSDSRSVVEVAERHQALFRDWGKGARTAASFNVDPASDRPLRIGFVSSDLHHQHPVNIFLQPMLARWDHQSMPATIYFTGETMDDQTRLARRRAAAWRQVAIDQLPAQVKVDKIDVLVDLAGHTVGGAMRQFAQRMAPVQVSFLGYPGSTGVPNMDWLIGDSVVTPPEADHLCNEMIARLPHTVFCFAPEVDYPLPDFEAVARGRPLTFGSFNNISKLTPKTIRLWSDVLTAVPGSRLVLRAPSFKDRAAVERFRAAFGKHGIQPGRLDFRGPVGLDAMMQAYRDIDIGLDPVPYCGGTTTLQAMWMGVPVVTLEGGHFVSRMGASFMRAAGLAEWVARSDAEYVAAAALLSADPGRLLDLKSTLRQRLMQRPGWDIDRYTADFMQLLRKVWTSTGVQPL